jgi:hypothetical protein
MGFGTLLMAHKKKHTTSILFLAAKALDFNEMVDNS